MNYEPNDRLFLFGFSRGAFTVRSLAGLVGRCGLIDRGILMAAKSARAQTQLLDRVIDAYRWTKTIPDVPEESVDCKERRIRDELNLSDLKPRSIPIEFIGVWDTVDAVGLPFEQMKHVIGYLWARAVGRRLWHFNDQVPHHRIRHAYQALALDDERRTFHPILWDSLEDGDGHDEWDSSCQNARGPSTRTQVKQVWFAGMHANVGGGYPRDELSHVSLSWMVDNASRHGLIFLNHRVEEFRRAADVHGHMYNSRTGLRMFYRPGLRDPYWHRKKLPWEASWRDVFTYARNHFRSDRNREGMERRPIRPLVHESVYARARRASNGYAPKVLVASRKEHFARVAKDGLPGPVVERLRRLDSTHKKIHCLFVTLVVFVLTWTMPFKIQYWPPISQFADWWKGLMRQIVPQGTVVRLEEFSAVVAEGAERVAPGIVASVLEVMTSRPVEAAVLLVALAVLWKANRVVDVETRLYAFKRWHWIGEEWEIDRRLKGIEKILTWRAVDVGRRLFVLLVLVIVLMITGRVLLLIPREIYLVMTLLVFVERRVRVFER